MAEQEHEPTRAELAYVAWIGLAQGVADLSARANVHKGDGRGATLITASCLATAALFVADGELMHAVFEQSDPEFASRVQWAKSMMPIIRMCMQGVSPEEITDHVISGQMPGPGN